MTLAQMFTQTPVDFRPKRRNGGGWSSGVDLTVQRYNLVGRTVPRLHTTVPAAEIEDLAEQLGFEDTSSWGDMSPEQRLDTLATHFIETSRENKARVSEFVLSPWQWYSRLRREVPMTQEQMEALVRHNDHLIPYRGPTCELSIDHNTQTLRDRERSDQIAMTGWSSSRQT